LLPINRNGGWPLANELTATLRSAFSFDMTISYSNPFSSYEAETRKLLARAQNLQCPDDVLFGTILVQPI
jgi:hypothetical protein